MTAGCGTWRDASSYLGENRVAEWLSIGRTRSRIDLPGGLNRSDQAQKITAEPHSIPTQPRLHQSFAHLSTNGTAATFRRKHAEGAVGRNEKEGDEAHMRDPAQRSHEQPEAQGVG